MNEMPLPSSYRIQNSDPGGLRQSTLPLRHGGFPQYSIFTSEWGRNSSFSLKLEGQSGIRIRDIRLSKQVALNTASISLFEFRILRLVMGFSLI